MDSIEVKSRITENGLEFTLPGFRSLILIFVCLWMLAISGFFIFLDIRIIIKILLGLSDSTGSDLISFLNYLPLFLIGIIPFVYSLYLLLWQIVGVEIIEIDTLAIRVTRRILFLERSKKYSMDTVYNLRAFQPLRSLRAQVQQAMTTPSQKRAYKPEEGYVAFEYDNETHYFGSGINLEEAEKIVAQIHRRFPACAKNI